MMWLTRWGYLIALIVSIGGMTLIDWRYRLAWWANRQATAWTIALVYALLLAADVVGITWQIFATNSTYVTGIYFITPNLPIEEFFFLYLLCHCVLVAYRAEEKFLRGSA